MPLPENNEHGDQCRIMVPDILKFHIENPMASRRLIHFNTRRKGLGIKVPMAIPGSQIGGTYHIFLAYFLRAMQGDIPTKYYLI